MDRADAAAGVLDMARHAALRGWVPATSGNFSARIDGDSIALTASGADKNRLSEADVIEARLIGAPPARASAETPLHLARYRADGSIGAIAHVHSVAATVLSRRHAARGALTIEGWELMKAFAGVRTHEVSLAIPILDNDQDTERLASAAEARLSAAVIAPGYLIAGHGLYAWGATATDAIRHLDAFDFLFQVLLQQEALR